MKCQIVIVGLPAAVIAVEASVKDGSLTFYVNALCPLDKQEEAGHKLFDATRKGVLG